MDLRKILVSVRRYWFAVLGVLILTAVAVALVPSNISADFEAQGSVILLSPSTVEDSVTGEQVGINPWSRFGSSGEGVAAAAIIEVLESEAFAVEVMDSPAIEEYQVSLNPGGNGAIIDITVNATEAAPALAALDLIVDRIVTELEARQVAAGAPEATWLSADVLTRPAEATELQGSRSRAMLALAALGAVASIAVAIGLDALRTGRGVTASQLGDGPPDDESPASADPGGATSGDPTSRDHSPEDRQKVAAGAGEADEPAGAGASAFDKESSDVKPFAPREHGLAR